MAADRAPVPVPPTRFHEHPDRTPAARSREHLGPDDGSAPPAIDIDSAPIVVYTDDGFTPSRLEIEAGQTVVFVNESGGQMWPASNIHPTHEILPALDALKPLEPSESWSFTFDEPGFWRYHNHMSPSSGGLIVVAGESVARVLKPILRRGRHGLQGARNGAARRFDRPSSGRRPGPSLPSGLRPPRPRSSSSPRPPFRRASTATVGRTSWAG